MRRIRSRTSIVLLCLTLCFAACDSGGGSPTPPETGATVAEGWIAFEAGDFTGARTAFTAVLQDDPTNGEAHNGLGWSELRLGNLFTATGAFDDALANGVSGADPHVGNSIALRDINPVNYDATIASVDLALGINAAYQFAHDTTLDWHDLRVIRAQSLFALARYAEAGDEVIALGGTAPNSASPTFVEELLAEIERLGELYSGQ